DAYETDPEGIFRHFTDAAHAAVAQMIDVVHLAIAVADVDQDLEHIDDVGGLAELLDHALRRLVRAAAEVLAVIENTGAGDLLAADPAVELHAAHGRKVVALPIEEEVREEVLCRILGRRLAGTHHAIDLDQRLEARLGRVDTQRV